jgi:hypothetical protein
MGKEIRTTIREKYRTITKRVQFADSVTKNRCSVTNFVELTTNQDGSVLKITGTVSVAWVARVIFFQKSLVVHSGDNGGS